MHEMRRKLLIALRVSLRDFSRNNGTYMAAGIAYWGLISLFPLALAGLAVLGFFYANEQDQQRVVEGIVKLVPVSRDYLAGLVEDVANARGPIGGLGLVGLLWTGTTVFSAIRKGINHAWGIGRPRYFLVERGIDLAMLAGMTLIASAVITTTSPVSGHSFLPGWLSNPAVLRSGGQAAAFAVTLAVFLLLYRYVPNTRVAWRDVWAGAVAGALLFQGVQVGFTWYVAHFGSFNLVYGSLGALMAVLVWAYLSALALIWGAQLAATWTHTFGSRAASEPLLELSAPRRRAGPWATLAGWLLPIRRRDR